MKKSKLIFVVLISLLSCNTMAPDTKFGKQYNAIRLKYGSPIIHDYMELHMDGEGYESWRIPSQMHDTISKGFHAGKGFYIHEDSVLQEDDIFRRRISDTTFAFIGILTRGNIHENRFTSIYYDTACANSIGFDNGLPCTFEHGDINEISIEEADSILNSWGTSRIK